jgi:type IV fimbrial biogenesis protein FimT
MASTRRRLLGKRHGFTVIELMVMLTVAGIILAVSLPAFNNMLAGFRHSGTVNEATSQLFRVRQMAVREKIPYVVRIDTVNDRFSAFGDANGNGVADPGENVVGPWLADTDVSLVNVSWIGNQVTYFPNGRASQTADFRVVDAHGRTKTVRLSSITGNAEVLP